MKTAEKIKAINALLMVSMSQKNSEALLKDLLTDSEVDKIYERVQIIDCLKQGMSQRAIAEKTRSGIATVTRGSHLLKTKGLVVDQVIEQASQMTWWHKLFWGK